MKIILILDESGSIMCLKQSYIDMVNEIITEQRDKVDASAELSLYLFNIAVKTFHENIPLHSVPTFGTKDYNPDGMTGLYDAIGYVMERHSSMEDTICIIFTDGEENCSNCHSQQSIFNKITKRETKGHWNFLFMGANIDSWEVGEKLGIAKNHCYDYSNSRPSVRRVSEQANMAIGKTHKAMTQERTTCTRFFTTKTVV